MLSPLRLAYLNISRRRVPSAVAFLAIALSVASGGCLLRLYRLAGSRFDSIARGGDAVIGAKAGEIEILLGSLNLEGRYPGFIPFVLGGSLQSRRGMRFADGTETRSDFVRAAIPMVICGRYQGFRVIGTTGEFLQRPRPEDSPRLAAGEWPREKGETAIGATVARATNLHVGDHLSATRWTGDDPESPAYFDLRISGILAPTDSSWDRALYTTLEQAFALLERSSLGGRSIWKAAVVNYFLIYLQPDSLPALRALIDQRSVAQVISVPEARQRLEELAGTGTRLGLALTVLILFLGGLSVGAMMLTRFEAMAVAMAMLRAVGYSRRELARWLWWEGLLLGSAAVLAGAALDAIAFPLIRGALGAALPLDSASPLWQSAPVWALALLATMAASCLPLRRITRQDVPSALRGV